MMTFGQRIQQLRIAAGLSQEALGARLNTTRQTVSRWELDQALPTIDRIVRMSRLFGVTTDSLLVDGISTFSGGTGAPFLCGVYRGGAMEVVETERFAFVISCAEDTGDLHARLYQGSPESRRLIAGCVRQQAARRTLYAYRTEDGTVRANDEALASLLGQRYDPAVTGKLRRRERFLVDHSGAELPTVAEAGIRRCLTAWRMADSLTARRDCFHFFLCTGQTEYVMSIRPEDTNVYCGASFNIPFDMGLFSGGQYFRLRNFGDNSAPYCGFRCDFTCEPRAIDIPTEECQYGQCVMSSRGMMWCVKRYGDAEIVLQGCGEDEYT